VSTPLPAHPPLAFVFDFDGTILDTEWPEYITVATEYERRGLRLELTEWQERIGTAGHAHWSTLLQGLTGPIPDIERSIERVRAAHRRMVAESGLRDGVIELIELARRNGLGLAIATSSPRVWAEHHLVERGLIEHFDAVVTRDDVAAPKPAPDLYALACRRLGVPPELAVAFEDSQHGCTAAVVAGLRCVVAPNRVTLGQDFSRAHLVVDSLAEVHPARHLGFQLDQIGSE
jgi:HAD superfamily hydrolase (TIGR01509 family)